MAFVSASPSLQEIDAHDSHRTLLAYYRLLRANRLLPSTLDWSLTPLSKLIWSPHPDPGVRFLAIRCYALHAGMMENERENLERTVVGDVSEADCPITYEDQPDGSVRMTDGWIMPVLEAQRVSREREALMGDQKYPTTEAHDLFQPIHPAELRYVVDRMLS